MPPTPKQPPKSAEAADAAWNLLAAGQMFKRPRSVLLLAGGVAAALAAAALAAPRDLVLYNHSPSVPEGLYVRTSGPVTVGAFVTVRARDVAPAEAHRRRYDRVTDRFIKRVAASAGARVCGDGHRLSISGAAIVVVGGEAGERQQRVTGADMIGGGVGGDHVRHVAVAVLHADDHRSPEGWRGCRVLAEDEVLLLGETPDSFDGRYWGPINTRLIEGVWRKF